MDIIIDFLGQYKDEKYAESVISVFNFLHLNFLEDYNVFTKIGFAAISAAQLKIAYDDFKDQTQYFLAETGRYYETTILPLLDPMHTEEIEEYVPGPKPESWKVWFSKKVVHVLADLSQNTGKLLAPKGPFREPAQLPDNNAND